MKRRECGMLVSLLLIACGGVWAGPKTWDPGEAITGNINAPAANATIPVNKTITCSATGRDPSDHWSRVSPPPLQGWEGEGSSILGLPPRGASQMEMRVAEYLGKPQRLLHQEAVR